MRASIFVLVVALVGMGGERVAAAQSCDPSYRTGVLCQNPTPVCVGLLTGTCQKCTNTGVLGLNNCPMAGQTCLASGSCVTGCSSNYGDGGVDGGCPEALPYCNSAAPRTCAQCAAGTPHDPFCPSTAPSCNTNAVCGCTVDGDCSGTPGATCDTTGGVYGAGVCVVTCSDNSGCMMGDAHHCAVHGGADTDGSADGQCVQCLASGDCDAGQVCNTSADTCFTVPVLDAGAPDSGAVAGDGGPGSDGGTTDHDAGIADGGTSTRDATVSDSGEGETTDTFPPGKIEGGGCSVLTVGGGGSDSPAPPALFGFAGLAGLFFLRRSQRRSSKGHSERR